MTGKMRTVEIDAENCEVLSKEDEERVFTQEEILRFSVKQKKLINGERKED